jgi:hypothetical protein
MPPREAIILERRPDIRVTDSTVLLAGRTIPIPDVAQVVARTAPSQSWVFYTLAAAIAVVLLVLWSRGQLLAVPFVLLLIGGLLKLGRDRGPVHTVTLNLAGGGEASYDTADERLARDLARAVRKAHTAHQQLMVKLKAAAPT